ncbi:restriction endonuclease subunit S [Bifidobacterium sp. 79T10]|nr:restriction endonuclease subunit S [Bifidobacterium saguinibicoloris]
MGELYSYAGSGGTPSVGNCNYYGGDIPLLGISDVSGRYIKDVGKYITREGLENSAAWLVPAGAIALAMYASVGKVGITYREMATSQAFFNMVFTTEATRDFVFARLDKANAEDEWTELVSTGTQSNLNAEKVRSWIIAVPSQAEQQAIGQFFSRLDDLITLHQRERRHAIDTMTRRVFSD